jgi:beta-galactosidase
VADTVPAFYRGVLNIEGKPADTFIRLDGFEKGFVKVNGFNIGRYFNSAGPQKTLYVPAPLLLEGGNEIVIFESDRCDVPRVIFTDVPELG